MKLLLVEWVDSTYSSGWQLRDSIDEDITNCVTVGILLQEKKDILVMALSLSKVEYSQAMTIPKCAIKRMRTLRVK